MSKGDKRRPQTVSDKEVEKEWNRIFKERADAVEARIKSYSEKEKKDE